DREPPRDFTIEQLREFNGTTNKKIYVALKGEVYDVSSSSEYYGPGSTYDCFAGRDASRAMAKLSFEESELSNPNIDDLGPFERDVLENWVEKFQYMKCYPVVGKLSYPARDRVFTPAELWECRGYRYRDCAAPTKEGDTTEEDIPAHHGEKAHSAAAVTSAVEAVNPPEGRVHAEILICVKGKVLDVSYGGVEMYGPGGPYQKFAGLNISRALAKMSFAPEDLSSSDISDLTAEQLKILNDWEEKFEVKKKYPVVGHMAGAAVDIEGLNE
ncbi:MSBP1, partial [Symbiodinium microadriaticum]